MGPYRTQSRDTHPGAEEVLLSRLRGLSVHEKISLIRRACRAAEQWSLAGLRVRNPGVDEARLRVLAGQQRLGPALTRRAYGSHGTRP